MILLINVLFKIGFNLECNTDASAHDFRFVLSVLGSFLNNLLDWFSVEWVWKKNDLSLQKEGAWPTRTSFSFYFFIGPFYNEIRAWYDFYWRIRKLIGSLNLQFNSLICLMLFDYLILTVTILVFSEHVGQKCACAYVYNGRMAMCFKITWE